jgi:hypothetical protein
MKRVVSCLLALLLYAPLAVAQAPSEEAAPDEEVPMLDVPPDQLPQPDMVYDREMLGGKFVSSDSPADWVPPPPDPQAAPDVPQLPPPPSNLDQGNLPPGYTARWICWNGIEEEVKNGAAIFGVKPKKVLQENGQWHDFYPRVCQQKEVAPPLPPPQPPNWSSKLPSGYAARAIGCDEGEEEVENGAARFGLEPIKIRWDNQLVDWLPKVCHKKG